MSENFRIFSREPRAEIRPTAVAGCVQLSRLVCRYIGLLLVSIGSSPMEKTQRLHLAISMPYPLWDSRMTQLLWTLCPLFEFVGINRREIQFCG